MVTSWGTSLLRGSVKGVLQNARAAVSIKAGINIPAAKWLQLVHGKAGARIALLSAVLLFSSADRVWSLPSVNSSLLRSLIPFASFQKDFKITGGKDNGRVVALLSLPNSADDKRSKITF